MFIYVNQIYMHIHVYSYVYYIILYIYKSQHTHNSDPFPPVFSITANKSFSVVSILYRSYKLSILFIVNGIHVSSPVLSSRSSHWPKPLPKPVVPVPEEVPESIASSMMTGFSGVHMSTCLATCNEVSRESPVYTHWYTYSILIKLDYTFKHIIKL